MYQHILLAVELGDGNLYLEEQATKLQKMTKAKLDVIHIIEGLPGVYGLGDIAMTYDYREVNDNLIDSASESLQPLKMRLGKSLSNIIVRNGNINDEILIYAEKNDVDLIIVGSHGRHGLRLLLGSTANAILHQAKCDLLAVRFKE